LFKWGIGLAVLFHQPEVTDGEYPLSVGTGKGLFYLPVGTGAVTFGLPVGTGCGLAGGMFTLPVLRGTACGTN
ncbi:hypothetical protein Tco_0950710, partial [Tanacetum coccineum]